MLGPSPRSEGRPPLSLPTRAAIYALLAGLVVASFLVTPPPRAGVSTADGSATGRAVSAARGLVRGVRDVADRELDDRVAAASFFADTEPRTQVVVVDQPSEPAAPMTLPLTITSELRMLALMNASRERSGLVPFAMDEDVRATAREHSAAESKVRYVYHDGPDGSARLRDADACGTAWYGENTGKIWNDNVDALHSEFMSEPWEPINHRTNIMDPSFRRVGVGSILGPDAMYMTIVFCR